MYGNGSSASSQRPTRRPHPARPPRLLPHPRRGRHDREADRVQVPARGEVVGELRRVSATATESPEHDLVAADVHDRPGCAGGGDEGTLRGHLDGAEGVQRDGAVGEQDVAVAHGGLLVAEEELGGARLERVRAALQEVAQDDVRELRHEKRRHVDPAPEQAQVAALDGARIEQPAADVQHHPVVVARIRVRDRLDLRVFDGSPRIAHQRGMQRALGVARLLDRMDLRPQVVRAQEVVGDPQPPGAVALEQPEAAVAPEIRQARGPGATATPGAG